MYEIRSEKLSHVKRVQESMERIYKLKMHFHVSLLSIIAKLTCGIRLMSLRITPTLRKGVSHAGNQFHYRNSLFFMVLEEIRERAHASVLQEKESLLLSMKRYYKRTSNKNNTD